MKESFECDDDGKNQIEDQDDETITLQDLLDADKKIGGCNIKEKGEQ